MPDPFESKANPYYALVNRERQYSLWPAHLTVPAGWRSAYGPTARDACLSFIEEQWLHIVPASAREATCNADEVRDRDKPAGSELPAPRHRGSPQAIMDPSMGPEGLLEAHGLVPDFIGTCAALHPDKIAITDGSGDLTYGNLILAADKLAARLVEAEIPPRARIAIALPRGAGAVVAALAIWKAGCTYVQLDLDYPRARLEQMLRDFDPAVMIMRGVVDSSLAADRLVLLDEDEEAHSRPNLTNRKCEIAYVSYTSGSTGKPKGVMVGHAALANFVRSMRLVLGTNSKTVWMGVASFSFDMSMLDIWLPLATGARLVIGSLEQIRDPVISAREVTKLGVTHLQATPSYFSALTDSGWPGSPTITVLCGGEELRPDLAEKMVSCCKSVWNLYGPTETTVYSSVARVDRKYVTLGQPILQTTLQLLDDTLRPVSGAGIGSIYISGAGVAFGYHGAAAQTAERFVANPRGLPGSRVYRTGDLGQLAANGEISFLGRSDEQIKIRGFRVEPREVDECLLRHPQIKEALTLGIRGASQLESVLLSYVSFMDAEASKNLDSSSSPAPPLGSRLADMGEQAYSRALEGHVSASLPSYMVPTRFLRVSNLPTTQNGKIDRDKLQSLAVLRTPTRAAKQPIGIREGQLLELFATILGSQTLSIYDDLLFAGLDSLSMMRVVARARSVYGFEMSVQQILETRQIAGIAPLVRPLSATYRRLEPRPKGSSTPASASQTRLWTLDALEGPGPLLNVPLCLRLIGGVNEDLLRAALMALVTRHEALRTLLIPGASGPQQLIVDAQEAGDCFRCLTVDDLTHSAAHLATTTIFDIASDLPFRVWLLKEKRGGGLALLLLVHHIAVDGWSLQLLLRDLTDAYTALTLGRSAFADQLALTYADYAVWEHAHLAEIAAQGGLRQGLDYWASKLENLPVRIPLPTDRPRPASPKRGGGIVQAVLSRGSWTLLLRRAQEEAVTRFMVLQAAVAVTLSRQGGGQDIPLGTVVAGRSELEFEGIVGFFVRTVVLRFDLAGAPTFRELLKRTRSLNAAALAHQEVPYDWVVDALRKGGRRTSAPLFQVAITLADDTAQYLRLPGVVAQELTWSFEAAQFDLHFSFIEDGDEPPCLRLTYDLELFDRRSAQDLVAEFLQDLDRLVQHVDAQF